MTLDIEMDIPEAGLHVVAVGPFLILEMDTAKLDRAGQAAQTRVTVLNAHLGEAVERQVAAGAEIVQRPSRRCARARKFRPENVLCVESKCA